MKKQDGNGSSTVNWQQTPVMALRESVRELVMELGSLLYQLAAKSAAFLIRAYEIILADFEGGMQAKQARISLKLQIKAFKKLATNNKQSVIYAQVDDSLGRDCGVHAHSIDKSRRETNRTRRGKWAVQDVLSS